VCVDTTRGLIVEPDGDTAIVTSFTKDNFWDKMKEHSIIEDTADPVKVSRGGVMKVYEATRALECLHRNNRVLFSDYYH
jgi:hypothetical protein